MNSVLRDPVVQQHAIAAEILDAVLAPFAEMILAAKEWYAMDAEERAICIRHLVGMSESEARLSQWLDDMGCHQHMIQWMDVDPNDTTALEAQVLLRALGGLVAANGALVIVTADDEMY